MIYLCLIWHPVLFYRFHVDRTYPIQFIVKLTFALEDSRSWVGHWCMGNYDLQLSKEFNIQQYATERWWNCKVHQNVYKGGRRVCTMPKPTHAPLPFAIYRLCKLLTNLLSARLAPNLHIYPNIVPNESTKCWAFHWEEVDCKSDTDMMLEICRLWKPSNCKSCVS